MSTVTIVSYFLLKHLLSWSKVEESMKTSEFQFRFWDYFLLFLFWNTSCKHFISSWTPVRLKQHFWKKSHFATTYIQHNICSGVVHTINKWTSTKAFLCHFSPSYQWLVLLWSHYNNAYTYLLLMRVLFHFEQCYFVEECH